ncbi:tRNA pseudouridine synthase A [Spongiivirga citrea]|uniref:tRNA pseudouridine synthase A n=1 Tax=Spongiivirga citrea TaxID=1481457 RepID=A0A6M0CR45_9FLAO|nr:tRNA pseudouridine(38-40) synthase TruA [Spongiivirga citrea]NER16420.1 tRNA pseudouridine(38-40) synthase TruA [Spongiivirga citrea]
MRQRFYYIIKIQFLGFRYHGWQKQPGGLKTVEGMITKTLGFVLEGLSFKILGASRTDAKVSANEALFELFLDDNPLEDLPSFLQVFNQNLPLDIRALGIEKTDASFNIIQHPKTKEYIYLFSFGEKIHPFAASLMISFPDELDIELMKKGALLFVGRHNFRTYCAQANRNKEFIRTIDSCEIIDNDQYSASFFPESSYILRVRGKGFMRNQIRLMMGALYLLGKGEIDLDFIKNSLLTNSELRLTYIAPASGLTLNKIELE